MPTIVDYLKYAETAFAAYANGLYANVINIEAYKAVEMPAAEAAAFDDAWEVIAQSPGALNGFSAVLLRNRATNEKVLALRGTNDPADIVTDVLDIIGLGGVALMPQYASLEAFYLQLIDEAKLAPNEPFIVTGHSLGGFLAQAFTARHSSVVSAAYTYNAPGFGGAEGELLDIFGLADASAANGKIVNIYAENGLSATSGLGTMLGSVVSVRIEADTVNPLYYHSIATLTDTLSLYGAYQKLQPSFSLDAAAHMLTASGQGNYRLEAALDALRNTILGAGAPKTAIGNRKQFFDHLTALTDLPAFQDLAEKVSLSLAGAGLVTTARTDFSSFLSLLTLSPVVMKATAGNEALLEQTLGGAWGETYTHWQADKTAEHPEYVTDAWIKDRAALLSWVVVGNQLDSLDANGVIRVGASLGAMPDTWEFIDEKSNTHLLAAPERNNTHLVFFGDGEGRLTEGYGYADRLYGGAGDDTLKGNAGADYLEGDEGSDTLEGGTGQDILIGLTGDDTLTGGKDADRLEGGAGNDTYKIVTGDGIDTIIDSDGKGTITIDGVTLTGGTQKGSSWISEDGKFRYVLGAAAADGTQALRIFPVDFLNSTDVTLLTLEQFTSGNLGINLQNAPAPDPLEIRVIMGDVLPTTFTEIAPNGTEYETEKHDALGNYIGSAGGEPGPDMLLGSAGKDDIRGGAGNDTLYGRDGDDVLAGEIGADVIVAGLGADEVSGGEGDDYIYGDSSPNTPDLQAGNTVQTNVLPTSVTWLTFQDSGIGWSRYTGNFVDMPAVSNANPDAINPVLYQLSPERFGTVRVTYADRAAYGQGVGGDDVIDAGAGNDVVQGEAGNDHLQGGAGDDRVIGGSGADYLEGGDDNDLLLGDQMVYAAFRWATWDVMGPYRFTPEVETYENEFGNDVLFGGAGNDYLFGMAGADVLFGEAGNDYLVGDFYENVSIPVRYVDEVTGEWVDDTSTHFVEAVHYHGNDILDGGTGDDYLVGLAGDDQLFGGAGADVLVADGNRSEVQGRYGNDYLDGGDGDDFLQGSGGEDELHGGAGNDDLWGDEYAGTEGQPVGSWGGAPVNTGSQTELLAQDKHGKDFLDGGDGNDTLTGGGFDDHLEGGKGNDLLFGDGIGVTNEGNDTLLGGEGDDQLQGGGGTGDDYLQGSGREAALLAHKINRKNSQGNCGYYALRTLRLAA